MTESQPELQPLLRDNVRVDSTPVYPIIHMIRSDVTVSLLFFATTFAVSLPTTFSVLFPKYFGYNPETVSYSINGIVPHNILEINVILTSGIYSISSWIDTPLTYEALKGPDITYTLVQPLVEKYRGLQRDGNMSIPFCFLLNRVHFLRDDNILTVTLSRSRAELCELLAVRTFHEYGNSMLHLTLTLTTSWPVYNGADPHLLDRAREERDDDLEDRVGNAIELAILGKAKRFIKSSSCQKVINAIWCGKCVYQAESSHSILSDTYKKTPIHFYDPHKAPLLDHYRLKVPAIRSILDYLNFLILFFLFIITIEISERDQLNMAEIIFMVYALGFTLEKVAAMQEHGIKVYFKGTWNGFDLAFVTTFCIYAFLRLYGAHYNSLYARELGIDFLALIACLMFPRLAFVTLKDNLMVLSLRAMIVKFVVLMLIAVFCFCGFLYALWTLSRNEAGYSAGTIAWWMLDLWFGLDASGFDRATQFHSTFGPVLMVTYACLSNTLLLTILVSILSNTFATINEDAAAEAMFRKAVSTIEGVKADSLFSYQPPVNLIALCVMLPASYFLSPRWFHKVNVALIRLTSFPLLLVIAWYERQSKQSGTTTFYDTVSAAAEKVFDTLPRHLKRLTFFEGLVGPDSDINAIFEIEEEFESALDTGETGSHWDHQPQHQASPIPPISPNTPPTSSNMGPAPRARLSSAVSRGVDAVHTFTSPLAQVFQPLVVHDNAPDTVSSTNGPTGPIAVSYGPASRRRLSSMQSMQLRHPESLINQAQVNVSKKFPPKSSPIEQSALWQRPDRAHGESLLTERKPLIDSMETNDVGVSEWTRRMERMEKRQERIEELLVQLTKDIRK